MQDIESAGVEQAIDRLASQFPGVTREEISSLVHAEHERFTGRPVRDYIPVLVERTVRGQLRGRKLPAAS